MLVTHMTKVLFECFHYCFSAAIGLSCNKCCILMLILIFLSSMVISWDSHYITFAIEKKSFFWQFLVLLTAYINSLHWIGSAYIFVCIFICFYNLNIIIKSVEIYIFCGCILAPCAGYDSSQIGAYPNSASGTNVPYLGQQLFNDPMANMAVQYGQSLAGQGTEMIHKNVIHLQSCLNSAYLALHFTAYCKVLII